MSHEALNPEQFKESKYLYHESHLQNRESIQSTGLQPGAGQESYSGPNAPKGVYMSPHRYSEYGSSMHDASHYGYDRWRVNVEGLPLHTDPTQPKSAVFHPGEIPPERLKIAKKGHPDWRRHI
jgi:hypothetical protein